MHQHKPGPADPRVDLIEVVHERAEPAELRTSDRVPAIRDPHDDAVQKPSCAAIDRRAERVDAVGGVERIGQKRLNVGVATDHTVEDDNVGPTEGRDCAVPYLEATSVRQPTCLCKLARLGDGAPTQIDARRLDGAMAKGCEHEIARSAPHVQDRATFESDCLEGAEERLRHGRNRFLRSCASSVVNCPVVEAASRLIICRIHEGKCRACWREGQPDRSRQARYTENGLPGCASGQGSIQSGSWPRIGRRRSPEPSDLTTHR
jgi:hypothetical protein